MILFLEKEKILKKNERRTKMKVINKVNEPKDLFKAMGLDYTYV